MLSARHVAARERPLSARLRLDSSRSEAATGAGPFRSLRAGQQYSRTVQRTRLSLAAPVQQAVLREQVAQARARLSLARGVRALEEAELARRQGNAAAALQRLLAARSQLEGLPVDQVRDRLASVTQLQRQLRGTPAPPLRTTRYPGTGGARRAGTTPRPCRTWRTPPDGPTCVTAGRTGPGSPAAGLRLAAARGRLRLRRGRTDRRRAERGTSPGRGARNAQRAAGHATTCCRRRRAR